MAASRYGKLKLGIAGATAAGIVFGAAYLQGGASASGVGAVQASASTDAAGNAVTLSTAPTSGSTTTGQAVTMTARARTTRGS